MAGRLIGVHRDMVEVWLPVVVVAVATATVAAVGIRGADYPAHFLRAELWERFGFGVWNMYWYGGHPTPTYSIITPPVTALVGPVAVAGASSALAAYACSRLMSACFPGRATWLANLTVAIGLTVNVVVGRTPFAMGLALCSLALLAWHRAHLVGAIVFAVLTPLASPVAATFLVVASTSVALDHVHRRREVPRAAIAIAIAAAAPVVVTAALYESPGRFPFRGEQFVLVAVGVALVFLVNRHPVVRFGALLTGVVSAAIFVVPNPLGGNFARLVQLAAPPLLIVAMPGLRGAARRPTAWLVAVGIVWSVQPGVVAAVDWAGDPSADVEYHAPLIEEVLRRNEDGRPLGRITIPFTENHWEAYFVAPAVPYARGWERQVDLDRNEELYDRQLTLAEYRSWLDENAVRWVALPDVPIDEGGRPEYELIGDGTGIPWMRSVWSNADWRLFEVLDYQPIVDPPAELVHHEADRLIVRTDRAAVVTIRFTFTEVLVIDGGACVAEGESGDIVARLPAPDTYELAVAPERALPGGGPTDDCSVP